MSKKTKHFNILMAGVISGIVAITTATLGLTGTVIGSVLSSIIYQLLSTYSEEKIDTYSRDGIKVKKLETNIGGEVVYLLPIVVITLIELVYLLTTFHYNFVEIFNLLETATNQNLFRVMGLGMIVLSFYPFFRSNNIPKKNGVLVFFTGGIILLRGLVDVNNVFFSLVGKVFDKFDFFATLIILLLLLIIIVGVISSIFNARNENKDNVYDNEYRNQYRSSRNPRDYDPLDFDELEMSRIQKSRRNRNYENDYNREYIPNKRVVNEEDYQNYHNPKNSSSNYSNKSMNASDKTKKFFNNKFNDKKR
ncbi:hypothetical protein ACA135_06830 [Methanobrevibacter acididurans]|uniref:hypothetical protein n=1 Tax=Methanobrevibacter acididurans TaxID=120963 RepID=UPI0038FBF8DE